MPAYRFRFTNSSDARRSASRLGRYYGAVAVVVGSVVLVAADKLDARLQNALVLADWEQVTVE